MSSRKKSVQECVVSHTTTVVLIFSFYLFGLLIPSNPSWLARKAKFGEPKPQQFAPPADLRSDDVMHREPSQRVSPFFSITLTTHATTSDLRNGCQQLRHAHRSNTPCVQRSCLVCVREHICNEADEVTGIIYCTCGRTMLSGVVMLFCACACLYCNVVQL